MDNDRGLYPVYLDMKGKPCLVVGGGRVAERKVEGLLRAKARVVVVSPEATKPIQNLDALGRLVWIKKTFETSDLEGRAFVVAASGTRALNRKVAHEARKLGILVNVADKGEEGDAFLPLSLVFKNLRVAVSSSGKCPAFSRAFGEVLKGCIEKGYPQALEIMIALRSVLLATKGGEGAFTVEPSLIRALARCIEHRQSEEARLLLQQAYPEAFEASLGVLEGLWTD